MSDRGNILVAGGAGYIGSNACKALARAGYLPITFDSLVHGHEWAVKWVPLKRGDILDRARLDQVITQYRPSAIMHFTAFAYVGDSLTDPGKYYRNNAGGSLNLLEAARDGDINQFVFSSNCATDGMPDRIRITVETPQHPINPYRASKLMVERMLTDFGTAHGLRSVTLSYFNAAGADPDGEIGEHHDPETHLIPIVLDAASGQRPHVTIFGDDYDTPDGTCIRDYIDVSDLADAHVKAILALDTGAGSQTFNLGNGTGFSVRAVIEAVEHVTGKKVQTKVGPRRLGDPLSLVSSADAAGRILLWSPQRAATDTIVGDAWTWSLDLTAERMMA